MERAGDETFGGRATGSGTIRNHLRRPRVKLNLSTEGIARASGRRPWITVGAWLTVLVAAIVLTGTLLGDALTTESTLTNNPESVRANDLLHERLGESNNTVDEMVIVRSTTLTVDDPAYRSYVEELYGDLAALGDQVIAGGTHYYVTGDESLVSADRRTTLVPLTMPEAAKQEVDKEEINKVHQVVDKANENGSFQVLITGEATIDMEINEIAERDLAIGEGIGVSVALVVLALVFGAIAAALIPIVLAIAAIVVALGATALVGQAFDLPFYVINILTMMGWPLASTTPSSSSFATGRSERGGSRRSTPLRPQAPPRAAPCCSAAWPWYWPSPAC